MKQKIYKEWESVFCMARLREIKNWAGTLVIRLTKSDRDDLGLHEGDLIDVEDIVKLRRAKKDEPKLSQKNSKEIKEAKKRMKKGEYYTEEEAKKILGLRKLKNE